MLETRNNFPSKPGVYFLKDKDGNIIYIGKAKSLKHRVFSYFTHTASPKVNILANKVKDIDYIVTNSELEALILEANLIKLHLPHYNIRLKDDKKYPYIKITTGEDFPHILPTRDLKNKNSIYFGPYTNVKTMKNALKTVTNIFPIRTCKGKLPSKACLSYHLGKCYAPCEKKISKEEYKNILQELIDFLTGKSEKVEQLLNKKMYDFAKQYEYEKAIETRNRLNNLQNIKKKQRVVFNKPIDIDVFGLQTKQTRACITLLSVREGRVQGSEHYFLHTRSFDTNGEIMRAFLLQYYKNASFMPSKIAVRTIEEKSVLEKWLAKKILIPKKSTKNLPVQNKDLLDLIALAETNAGLRLSTESKEQSQNTIIELQQSLKLKDKPIRIEAYDVSNIGDKYAVGSCVSFLNGKPQKSEYRRFKIREIKKQDDPKMIGEIVTRRMKYKKLPNMILIDGGKTQVRAARTCIPQEIPVFGLTKKLEEIHTDKGEIICLPKNSCVLKLLQQVRNEAHRFAISYHKKLRDKIPDT